MEWAQQREIESVMIVLIVSDTLGPVFQLVLLTNLIQCKVVGLTSQARTRRTIAEVLDLFRITERTLECFIIIIIIISHVC